MILASRLASAHDVRRFQREARAAGSLRHPHIVGIHEVGECHGQHYFTMDFIAGEDLARRLARGADRCRVGRRFAFGRGAGGRLSACARA